MEKAPIGFDVGHTVKGTTSEKIGASQQSPRSSSKLAMSSAARLANFQPSSSAPVGPWSNWEPVNLHCGLKQPPASFPDTVDMGNSREAVSEVSAWQDEDGDWVDAVPKTGP